MPQYVANVAVTKRKLGTKGSHLCSDFLPYEKM